MKRNIKTSVFLLSCLLLGCFTGCGGKNDVSEVPENPEKSESDTVSVSSSDESPAPDDIRNNPCDISNLSYDNKNAVINDADGPAYVIYSKTGYNKASFDIKLSEMQFCNVRKSDRKFVCAYLFLGMDIFKDGCWANCFDAGLARTDAKGGWHLFYNLYTTESEDTYRWYESEVKLDEKHDYRFVLDSSEKDGFSTLTAYDLTENKIADSVELESLYSKKNGSNTNYLQDYAFDYPENVKFDSMKRPSSDDFEEITLYNSGEGLYIKNLVIENVKIYKGGEEFDWTEEHTSYFTLWPDVNNKKIDYPVIEVWQKKKDCSFVIDIDMNRRK